MYIKLPEGVEISKEMQDCNGITRELLGKKGVELNEALDHFINLMKECDIMCGYHIRTVRRYLLSSAVRADNAKLFDSLTWQLLDTQTWWNGYFINLQGCILDKTGIEGEKDGKAVVKAIGLVDAIKKLYGEEVHDDAWTMLPFQKRMFLDLVAIVESTPERDLRHSKEHYFLYYNFYNKYNGCLRRIERERRNKKHD